MLRNAARESFWLVVMLLAGCSTITPKQPPVGQEVAAERALAGRISVHYRVFETSREETVFANFDWAERADDVDLSLLDPLGQTIAQVHSTPLASTLTLRDGRVFRGDSPEALTNEVLGWTLPVRGLRAWLAGHPAETATPPGATDAEGNRRFEEDGWTIVYPDDKAGTLPRRVNLTYPGPKIAIDLKIIVDTRSGS